TVPAAVDIPGGIAVPSVAGLAFRVLRVAATAGGPARSPGPEPGIGDRSDLRGESRRLRNGNNRESAGAAVCSARTRHRLGLRHHLSVDPRGTVVSGDDPGSGLAPGCRLGSERTAGTKAGPGSDAHGSGATAPCPRTAASLGSR